MKNLSGVPLLHALPAARRPIAKLPRPTADDLLWHLEDLVASVSPVLDATGAARRTAGAGQVPLFGGSGQ